MKLSKKLIVIPIVLSLAAATAGFAIMGGEEPEIQVNEVVEMAKEEPVVEVETEEPVVEHVPEPVVQSVPEPTPEPKPESDNPYHPNSPSGYVYNKRKEAGKDIGTWGFPNSWVNVARANGISIDTNPQYGDILVIGQVPYFVDGVNETTINVSTLLADIQSRDISKEEALAKRYLFIH